MTDTTAILERINDALRERALTQVELAERTGLSKTQMSRLLSGRRKLSAGELGIIAEALDLSAGELLGTAEPQRRLSVAARLGQAEHGGDLAGPFVRARRLLELRDRLARVVTTDHVPAGVEVNLPTTGHAKTAGQQLAERLRGALGLAYEPVEDLTALAEDVFGVDVALQPMPPKLHGLLVTDTAAGAGPEPSRDAPVAVALVNTRDAWGRQRFTLAHELSHLLFGDANLYLADFADRDGRLDLNELRADCFAAHFLAPASGVQAVAQRLTGRSAIKGLDLVDVDSTGGATLVTEIALRFGISIETALNRLHDSSVIDADQKAQLAGRGALALVSAADRSEEWDARAAVQNAVVPPPGLLGQALYAYREGLLGLQPLADLYDTDDWKALESDLVTAGWTPDASS